MKRKGSILLSLLGAAVVVLGFLLMEPLGGPLPGVLIGLGAGALGAGLSGVFSARIAKRHPEGTRQKADMARKKAVERQDERNIAVNNQAKARVYDMLIYVFSAAIMGCALMQAGLAVVLVLVGVYGLMIACYIGFFAHYNKTM